MFRKIENHKITAAIANNGKRVTVMCDDGWEDIIDHIRDIENEQEGRDYLAACGFEEYDPNAHLKAQGMVFINGCYRMPG